MHEVLVNGLGGLSLPRKSVVRLTDRPDMTLDVYRGRKTTTQQFNERESERDSARETDRQSDCDDSSYCVFIVSSICNKVIFNT